jgi:hypothetical protein
VTDGRVEESDEGDGKKEQGEAGGINSRFNQGGNHSAQVHRRIAR